jgi:hypothetical protein
VDGVRQLLQAAPGVSAVPRLEVLIVGPRKWLITGDVAVDPAHPATDVTRLVNELRGRLRSQPGVAEAYLSPVPAPAA